MPTSLGFLGLGNMGLAMAGRLLAAGHHLRVWNRTLAKAQPLVAKGAKAVERPEDVAEPGGLVISMVADDEAVQELAGPGSPLLRRLGKGGVHVSSSTISVETVKRLAADHGLAGVTYLAMPVLGRPDAVAAGHAWLLLAGPQAGKARVKEVTAALGQATHDFGDRPEAANVAKIVVNFTLVSAMEAMAEGFTLAQKSGVDPLKVAELLGSTLFDCPAYKGYGPKLARGPYEPAGFRLSLGLKDVTLALAAGWDSATPLPLASLVRDRMLGQIAKGRGDSDWSVLARGVREAAGLPDE